MDSTVSTEQTSFDYYVSQATAVLNQVDEQISKHPEEAANNCAEVRELIATCNNDLRQVIKSRIFTREALEHFAKLERNAIAAVLKFALKDRSRGLETRESVKLQKEMYTPVFDKFLPKN